MPPNHSLNPYSYFLGLPSTVSQPDHYELLGVERFTDNREAIQNAAIARNRELRQWQNNDELYPQVRKLEMEVALAMTVLVNSQKKSAYDQTLNRPVPETKSKSDQRQSLTETQTFNDPPTVDLSRKPESIRLSELATANPALPEAPSPETSTSDPTNQVFLLACCFAGLVCVSLLLFVVFRKGPGSPRTKPAVLAATSSDELESLPLSPQEKARREAAAKRAAEKKTEQVVQVEPKQEPPEVVDEDSWDRTLKTLEGYLVLPPRDQVLGMMTSKVETLTQIHVEDPKQIDLTIYSSKGSTREVGREDSDTKGFIIRAEDEESDEGQLLRRWIVQRKIIDPFAKLPKLAEVARFELAEESLTFRWNMEAPDWAKANSLQYCLLEISHKDQSHRFQLSLPKTSPREPYNLVSRDHKVDLAVHPNAVDDPTNLTLDLQLWGVDSKPFSKAGLRVGETATFTINPEVKSGNGRVEFDLTFQYDGNRPSIVINAYTFRQVLVDAKSQKQKAELTTLGSQNLQAAHTIPVEELRLSTNFSDFERITDRSDKFQKALRGSRFLTTLEQVEIPKRERLLKVLREDLRKEKENSDPNKQADLERDIAQHQSTLEKLKDIVDGYQERIKLLGEHIPWSQEMQTHFEELGKTAQVSYSLYITIDGEKVYLARTEREESPANFEE